MRSSERILRPSSKCETEREKKKVVTSLKKQFGAFMGLYPQFLVACVYANSNLAACGDAVGLGSMRKHSTTPETVLNQREGKAFSQTWAYLEYISPNVYSHLET
jgi:hypothetical protein